MLASGGQLRLASDKAEGSSVLSRAGNGVNFIVMERQTWLRNLVQLRQQTTCSQALIFMASEFLYRVFPRDWAWRRRGHSQRAGRMLSGQPEIWKKQSRRLLKHGAKRPRREVA